MNISLLEKDSIVFLKINGQINLYTVTDLKEVFQKELEKGFTKYMLDMKMVHYVDSSGVGAFILHVNNLKKHDGKMAMYNIDDTVRVVFAMTKLNNFFSLFDNEKDALNYIAS